MISTREFEQMKDGVVLVNTARGAVIDEGALVKALDSGKVASVGLDVYEQEPNIHWGLKANPNVILLPHMGTWTVEVSQQYSLVVHRFLMCSFGRNEGSSLLPALANYCILAHDGA
jgi:lactate dehydrogenase-like 2-hydroxyacid dehydrogenase